MHDLFYKKKKKKVNNMICAVCFGKRLLKHPMHFIVAFGWIKS